MSCKASCNPPQTTTSKSAPPIEGNLTAVLHGIKDLRLEDTPIPKPNNDEVLLEMQVVGICGSDVHYMEHGSIGPFIVDSPMVIGHEASGKVIECGDKVKHLKPGDRVAIEPGVPCRYCTFCKEGKYNLCPDVRFCATPPTDGNLRRYYAHAADFCHKLPENMDFEDGALLEPLSVAVRCCQRANVGVGAVCVILGAGPIGLANLLCAKAMGSSKILITDIESTKLEKAKELGATCTLLIESGKAEGDLVREIKELLEGDPNIAIECTGFEPSVRLALNATKSGGVAVLVGLGQFEMNLPITDAVLREVDIKGIFRYVNNYPTAMELVRSGKVNVKALVTHRFPIEETLKAFETAITREGNPIKILIHVKPQ